MPSFLDPSSSDDLPRTSVELDALGLLVEAYIAAEGREKGQQLLAAAARILALQDECERVVEFLPPRQRAERAQTRRQTAAWFRKSLPIWISRMTSM